MVLFLDFSILILFSYLKWSIFTWLLFLKKKTYTQFCYELPCVLFKILVLKSTPSALQNVTVCTDGDFKERKILTWENYGVPWSSITGILTRKYNSDLPKDATEFPFYGEKTTRRHRVEAAILKLRREATRDTKPVNPSILSFSLPEL